MHFSAAFILAALPYLALAAPRPASSPKVIQLSKRGGFNTFIQEDGAVNIPLLRQHAAAAAAKINRGNAIIAANTGEAPANSKRSSGTDTLTDDNSQLWYGPISVGGQSFTVDFDTGSSDLFLPGPNCGSTCSGHKKYSPGSSARNLGKSFKLSYGDGSTVSGTQYTDTVSIAGLTVQGQTLGAANTYSTGFASSRFPADGLLGMGFESLSVYNANPFFQSAIADGITDNSVFGMKLTASGAELVLGADDSQYAGGLQYTPVTQQGYWQVNCDGLSANGQQAVGSISSIIDSGTTLVIGDSDNVAALYQAIGGTDASQTVGAGFYTVPCDNIPTVSVTFSGNSYTIAPEVFNLGQASSGSSDCVGGIISSDIGSQFWIFGDVFMSNVYTSFDVGNAQVGFTQL